MDQRQSSFATQEVTLAPGAQAVINGALVTAREACVLEVGAGAFVMTGRALWRDGYAAKDPCHELYFSILEASADQDRFAEAQFRLFRLLGEVVASQRTYEAQKECALCASALLAGHIQDAVDSAARLSAARLAADKPSRLPGQRPEPRRDHLRDLRAQP